MAKSRIQNVGRSAGLSDADRLELAKLLIKAGYSVRINKEKPEATKAQYVHYVEFWEEKTI